MSYSQQLYPWCIVRLLSNNQHQIVVRSRRHNDAVAYLQVLQNSSKNVKYMIIFDVQGVSERSHNF
ncbi:MAG: hypothetical protein HC836_29655 [Richelia sp. RM2_1_2]|nr:hypothetical protein [Richelia sp. RM1_1_1]NJO62242.1 hypothetical protein [Richelia sp. RM2_1_2]